MYLSDGIIIAPIDVYKNRKRINRKKILKKAGVYLFLCIISFIYITPFFWILSTSLKSETEIMRVPPTFVPQEWHFENYRLAWQRGSGNLGLFTKNTIIVVGIIMIGQIFFCSLAGYAFARIKFPARDFLFFLYLATLMIPESVTLIPRFAIIIKMGWIDTYTALIMPYFLGSALGTFLMRQFFFTIPIEIEEAARIDGANSFCIFWKVMLPLIKPALATLVAITLVVNWNNFLWPLVVINRESMKVLSVGMTTFRLQQTVQWNLLNAGVIISLVPILIIFFFAQKFFIRGITFTGLK